MRLTGDWIEAEPTQRVLKMLEEGGHQALLVGGCVRNSALGAPVNDIDIASDARPERVIELAKAAGLKPVPTGVDHGTVTVVADGHPHEVTTFRRDVETHGRHATVAFSDDIAEDAARRDFTMNALYARSDGTVLDPLGTGLEDLAARHVRFVGEAEERIREDYLRILRFFRFTAWHGHDLDPDGLAACAANTAGIETLSRERLGGEMLKLLAASDPVHAVAAMAQCGVLTAVLPGADATALGPLVHLEDRPADPIRRLAAIGGEDVAERLRLSKKDTRQLEALRASLSDSDDPAVLGYRLGAHTGADAFLLRQALMGQEMPEGWKSRVNFGAKQQFPVQARDLMPRYEGKALGDTLKTLEARWIDSGFTLTREDLLAAL
ncbi:CCA tRNA nucleotidyltransferase [Thioclava sp. F34-6]|uniref:CCA tRNA nucleotidyltransferase n=1 Tax=Thioclava sp. F34-6 TaxID=1973003 RepID=UPI000B54456A|nr:CCA tRNA nucleotidyltransferase [Thioclava sp. F34-6]OWY13122.1 CCA tRNA nucleotidyltransferase [Thioclava sp. F34-6]